MRYFKKIILVVIMSAFICLPVKAEMTLKELFFDESKPFHLKILDVIPEEGIVQIGDENAKNTIIEFMDYFCGYCKKVHPELLQIANEREDTRIVFLQHPILSESSKLLANMVVAANMQNKGIDFHNALFEVEGNLNNAKLKQIIENFSRLINLNLDDESSYGLAKISRGTPRIALRLLRRVRDYAQVVNKTNFISVNLIKKALNSYQIDEKGLDSLDRQYLSFLNQNNNIPTGLDSIAAGLGDDSSMLEFVVEPYLIQIGYLTRTPRGRLLTALGKKYIDSEK